MNQETRQYLNKLKRVKRYLAQRGYNNWVVCGSGAVYMTGLLNRIPHDVDAYILGDNVYEDFYFDKRKNVHKNFTLAIYRYTFG